MYSSWDNKQTVFSAQHRVVALADIKAEFGGILHIKQWKVEVGLEAGEEEPVRTKVVEKSPLGVEGAGAWVTQTSGTLRGWVMADNWFGGT